MILLLPILSDPPKNHKAFVISCDFVHIIEMLLIDFLLNMAHEKMT